MILLDLKFIKCVQKYGHAQLGMIISTTYIRDRSKITQFSENTLSRNRGPRDMISNQQSSEASSVPVPAICHLFWL